MFRQRLAGHSVASIARHLNERGVPCPSSADPDRNRHRRAWTLRTVAVILANPRYTGRQIWNRRATGTEGPASTPALSAKAAYPPIVTEQDFVSAQQIRAARPAVDGRARRFALAGLIHCGCLRPATGLALEPRTPDLPLPPRPHQHPAREPAAAEDPLHPRRLPRRRAQHPTWR
ncbi:recombinase family protein [Amycolatopsis sp. NPDC051128]|uniref:recombinase family protein n=1 Tax=Amycolatopsis sp. NPDC051128 TaxID=3155412 RepID=UPI00344992E4